MSKKVKPPKSVAQTKPTMFLSPFNTMEYVVIQAPEQLNLLGKSFGRIADDLDDSSEGFAATARVMYNPNYGYMGIIYYPAMLEDDLPRVMRTLCHECVHIWQGYSQEVLCEESPSAEFEAYTIEEFFARSVDEYYRLLEINEKWEAAHLPSLEKVA